MSDIDYSQPDFYRFSEDSIILSHFIGEFLGQVPNVGLKSLLELGAGCGVISCEVAKAQSSLTQLTVCEIQPEFQKHLEINLRQLNQIKPSLNCDVFAMSWDLLGAGKFDLIVSNPPYFIQGKGRVGPNEKRERARRWTEHERDSFFQIVTNKLSPKGLVFLVLREAPPQAFLKNVKLVTEKVIHQRSEVLTRVFVFALNIETDEGLF